MRSSHLQIHRMMSSFGIDFQSDIDTSFSNHSVPPKKKCCQFIRQTIPRQQQLFCLSPNTFNIQYKLEKKVSDRTSRRLLIRENTTTSIHQTTFD
mmetsp:Transcript_57663/g.140827  ORF Transcript_57663/g.140827 Transcript_57663/m.140827 type:complete len:95 (-) Transcript_57663:905-1189(-)